MTGKVRNISSPQEEYICENASAVSLLFAAGSRPTCASIKSLSASGGNFVVSLDPAEDIRDGDSAEKDRRQDDWLELLANGLTFDLHGLAPGKQCAAPPKAHFFGLGADFEAGFEQLGGLEVLTLTPGPHLIGSNVMMPVMRCLALLAAKLSGLPDLKAIAWHPARTWNSPTHFCQGVERWIEGGVFPGLGLTALAKAENGGIHSEGLALFTGQELHISPALVQDQAEAAKLALRLIHWLVENGKLTSSESMIGPDGSPLRLEPSENLRIVEVWRG